jgi:hypothetical protein
LTTHRHFCTYFDHRYLAQGMALHASLSATCESFTLWVLALSEEAERMLAVANRDNVRAVSLSALEEFDPELRATRANRSLVEYYFTCSPCFPRYLFCTQDDVREVTYLDSDLYFFSDPQSVFDEIGSSSVAITPHRFTAASATTHAQFGRAWNGGASVASNGVSIGSSPIVTPTRNISIVSRCCSVACTRLRTPARISLHGTSRAAP